MTRFCGPSCLFVLLVGFSVSARAQTVPSGGEPGVVAPGAQKASWGQAPGQSSKADVPTAAEESGSKRASREHRVTFGLKEHPRLRVGRALTLNFVGKFDLDSGVMSDKIGSEAQFDLARRRVGVSGSLLDVAEFQIEREIGDDDPWRDVFVAVRLSKWLTVEAGKFKAPYSRAQLTSSLKLDFINRPLGATALNPGRRIGVMAEGSMPKKKVLGYQVGIFRPDRADERLTATLPQTTDGRMVAARATARPFRQRVRALDELEVGLAATTERLAEGLASVAGRTFADRSRFFPELYVKGQRRRMGYEASWAGGPLKVAGEYMRVNDERRGQGVRGQDLPDLVARGWYVSASWLLFGERRTEELPLGPALFTKRKGGLELGARIEALRFASDTSGEPAFRNPRAAHVLGNADHALTLGINWYASRFARVQCNLVGERVTDAERSPVRSTGRFWSVVAQLQLHS